MKPNYDEIRAAGANVAAKRAETQRKIAARLAGGPREPGDHGLEVSVDITDLARVAIASEAEERRAIRAADEVHPLAPGGALDGDPVDDAKPKADPLPLVYAPDLASPLPTLRWLSKSCAMIQGRVVVYTGFGDAGKTFAAMDTALAVASGAERAIGDMDVNLSGPVVHIDYEQQQWITAWRYQRMAVGRGIDLAGLGERLALVSLPPLYLTDARAEAEITRVLTGKALAVVDNLTAGCPALDQNATQIAAPLYMLGRVSSATGCTIIVIHHDNKAPPDGKNTRSRAQHMRGSGAIHAAIGGGLAFAKRDGGVIEYEQLKETMGPKASEPGMFRIVDVGEIDPNTERTTGLRLEWTPFEQAAAMANAAVSKAKAGIRAFLVTHGPGPKNDVLKGAKGASTEGKRRAMVALIESGEVLEESGEKNAKIVRLAGSDVDA